MTISSSSSNFLDLKFQIAFNDWRSAVSIFNHLHANSGFLDSAIKRVLFTANHLDAVREELILNNDVININDVFPNSPVRKELMNDK